MEDIPLSEAILALVGRLAGTAVNVAVSRVGRAALTDATKVGLDVAVGAAARTVEEEGLLAAGGIAARYAGGVVIDNLPALAAETGILFAASEVATEGDQPKTVEEEMVRGAVIGAITGAVTGAVQGALVAGAAGAVAGAVQGAITGGAEGAAQGAITGAIKGEIKGEPLTDSSSASASSSQDSGDKSTSDTSSKGTSSATDLETVATPESSFIAQIAYSKSSEELQVTMKAGGSYLYEGISADTWSAFKSAPSKGSFFDSTIKTKGGA